MSTRWYPIYQRGNPQLRIFLPNFWMKLIRPAEEQPKNVATFSVSMQMTKYDVKNYLEKIYKLPVVDVRTRIEMGKTKRDQAKGYVTKDDDVKIAYVTLVSTCMILIKTSLIYKYYTYLFCSHVLRSSLFPIYLRKKKNKRKQKKNQWTIRNKASNVS